MSSSTFMIFFRHCDDIKRHVTSHLKWKSQSQKNRNWVRTFLSYESLFIISWPFQYANSAVFFTSHVRLQAVAFTGEFTLKIFLLMDTQKDLTNWRLVTTLIWYLLIYSFNSFIHLFIQFIHSLSQPVSHVSSNCLRNYLTIFFQINGKNLTKILSSALDKYTKKGDKMSVEVSRKLMPSVVKVRQVSCSSEPF